jgi:hypothetical protein
MNLSHIIHEWSFGDYYPSIAQPLDMSVEIARTPFTIMQYFLLVVPTTYISSSGKQLETNQYSVTDYKREVDHGKGVPGAWPSAPRLLRYLTDGSVPFCQASSSSTTSSRST